MKFKKIVLCSMASLVVCFNAVSCGQKKVVSQTESHNYVAEVIAPTCTSQGYTLHTCVLGDDSYKDTYVDALGHNFVCGDRNYTCSRCDISECEGFEFKLATMDGESCYAITGASESAVVNGILNIPHKYESLNVRGIMNWSFSSVTKDVKKILIHDNIKNIYSSLWNGTSVWNADLKTTSTLEEIVFDSTCSGMRVESGAFKNCPKLSKANVKKGMIKYAPSDSVRGENGGTADYLFKDTPYFENNATVKNGLYYIADLLLYADLNELNSNITIDNGTVNIGNCLFYGATFMTNITIPNSIISIGRSAFNQCKKLSTITYKGTKEQFNNISIGSSAFSGVGTTKIICSDGEVTSYYDSTGYKYNIGA